MGELCTASFATALTYCIENQTGLSSIILVTLAVSVIHFTMYASCDVMWQKIESKLINKTKDPIARTDRHLNYVNRVSRDFSSAKDIRLYRLREYLMHMSQYFIGERKFWTQKMYFYYFCTDMMSLVLSVSIEIGIFAYIIYSTLHGNMSVTELVFYVFTVTEFTGFLDEVGANIVGCIQINTEIGNMCEFLDIKNIARNSGGKPLPTDFPYEIELQNVSFTYPECEKLLENPDGKYSELWNAQAQYYSKKK